VDEELAVLDKKLGGIVQEKLGINCIYKCVQGGHGSCVNHTRPQESDTELFVSLSSHSNSIMELTRGVRNQLQGLIR